MNDFEWAQEERLTFFDMFMKNRVDDFHLRGGESFINPTAESNEDTVKNLINELGKKISMYSKQMVQDIYGSVTNHGTDLYTSWNVTLHFRLPESTISVQTGTWGSQTNVYENQDNTPLSKRLTFPLQSTVSKYI